MSIMDSVNMLLAVNSEQNRPPTAQKQFVKGQEKLTAAYSECRSRVSTINFRKSNVAIIIHA